MQSSSYKSTDAVSVVGLEIPQSAAAELIDEWIVPTLVDQFLEEQGLLPKPLVM
jgi:hypothetical protein